MIVNVKGTKQTQADPDLAQKFVLKSMDRQSKTPFALGMLLASLVLYFKSFLSSPGSAQPAEEGAPYREELPPSEPEVTAEIIPLPVERKPEPEEPFELDTSSTVLDDFSAAAFYGISPEPFEFEMDLGVLSVTKPMVVAVLAANDNNLAISDPAQTSSADSSDQTGFDPVAGPDQEETSPEAPASPQEAATQDPTDGTDQADVEDPGETDTRDQRDTPDLDGEDEEGRVNRAPRSSGPVTLWDLSGCAPFLIGMSDLLSAASDPDGDPLTVQNVTASHGTITWTNGHWEFQAALGYEGVVTMTYEITDGEFVIEQVAYINVQRNTIEGTDGDDQIVGTDCGENIDGRAGDDNIYARGGDDIISGGEGDDHIVAGEGNDIVFGGNGHDIILGGSGDDYIFGEAGNDYLSGDEGDDIVFGGDGDDRLYGGAGDDILDGGDGDDIIEGGAGNDVLLDGKGSDRVAGGEGDDLVIAAADGTDDHFDGGAGFDTLDYSAAGGGIVIDMTKAVASGEEIGTDTFVNFEAVVGGTGDDHFIAAADGDDDHFDGGQGFDTLDYSATSEGIVIDVIGGVASGKEIGTDTFEDFEAIAGGSGDDHFIAAGGETVLAGGGGDDVFEFLPPEPAPVQGTSTPEPTLTGKHMILDFNVGDRVRMSKYDIFEKVLDEIEERFEEIYGDDFEDDDMAIRYRHDRVDDISRTVIEADFNNDGVWETAVMIDGTRALVIIEHA